jgi:hypothetical protein
MPRRSYLKQITRSGASMAETLRPPRVSQWPEEFPTRTSTGAHAEPRLDRNPEKPEPPAATITAPPPVKPLAPNPISAETVAKGATPATLPYGPEIQARAFAKRADEPITDRQEASSVSERRQSNGITAFSTFLREEKKAARTLTAPPMAPVPPLPEPPPSSLKHKHERVDHSVHIGAIEVRVMQPPAVSQPQPRVASQPRSAPSNSLSRGFPSPLGLRQA